MLKQLFRKIVPLWLGLLWVHAAWAQAYPTKPVRLIVPVASGGMTDIVSRLLAQKLAERLGQSVIVENKAGAGGNIGAEFVAKSAPDGHTLLVGYAGPLSVNPSLIRNMSFDPARDFVPVSLLVSYQFVLAVHPSLAARTVGEFIALAKQSPRPLSYGSAGNATTAHLTMEVFRREAGIPMLHIPYKGAAPAMNDLIAGQISSVFDSLTIVMPQHQAGRVRAIAVSGKERSPAYPDIPTVAESGLKDFDVTGWFGIVAPTGTPQPIVDRLTREWTTIVNDPAVRKELIARGLEPQGKDAQTFGQLISRERAMWQRIITENNIKAD